jgi:hypothetical protein
MKLVTKYQISTVTEKNATKNILDGRKDGRTDRGKTVYPPPPLGSGGIKMTKMGKKCHNNIYKYVLLSFHFGYSEYS